MKPTFIITSAVSCAVGVYDTPFRIRQTHGTIDSILRHYPDAQLILVDGGAKVDQQYDEMWTGLKSRVHASLLMDSNPQIEHLQKNFFSRAPSKNEMGGITGLTKSIAELTILINTLAAIRDNDDLKPIRETDRIFKISGRYQLSPLFETWIYNGNLPKNKYVFKERETSWMDKASQKAIGTEYGFCSRLWSMDISQLDDTIKLFETMLADVMEITKTHYIDMEHMLFKHLGTDNTMEIETLHVYGNIGPNGNLTYD
jgi:hypothetical protein